MTKFPYKSVILLVLISLVIGVYHISTCVLISKDGRLYISQAKLLDRQAGRYDFTEINVSPGYSLIVLWTHKILAVFGSGNTLQSWILAGQCASLFFRTLAAVFLLLLGCGISDRKPAFWGIAVLLLIPDAAKFGADVLRDWSYLFFLVAGMYLLTCGIKYRKNWIFALCGLAISAGHTIRSECIQIFIYASVWAIMEIFIVRGIKNKAAVLANITALLAVFVLASRPFWAAGGQLLPPQIYELKDMVCEPTAKIADVQMLPVLAVCGNNCIFAAAIQATGVLINRVLEEMLYVFAIPPIIAAVYFLRNSKLTGSRLIITAFIVFNILMMILLHLTRGYIDKRHCLPLVCFLMLFCGDGFAIIESFLRKKGIIFRNKADRSAVPAYRLWFLISLAICSPKLFRPINIDKIGYRDAALWLKENTDANDFIAVDDPRIGFYAERPFVETLYIQKTDSPKYVVLVAKNVQEKLRQWPAYAELQTYPRDRKKQDYKVIILKTISEM